MDLFIALASIAWPAVVLLCAVLYRRVIEKILMAAHEGEIGPKGFWWRRKEKSVLTAEDDPTPSPRDRRGDIEQ